PNHRDHPLNGILVGYIAADVARIYIAVEISNGVFDIVIRQRRSAEEDECTAGSRCKRTARICGDTPDAPGHQAYVAGPEVRGRARSESAPSNYGSFELAVACGAQF